MRTEVPGRQRGTRELVYLEPAGCSSLLSCSRGLAMVAC